MDFIFLLLSLIISICGRVILKVFGLWYKNLNSTFFFFIILIIVSVPVDSFTSTLPEVLKEYFNVKEYKVKFMKIILSFIGTLLSIKISDALMNSIKVNYLSAIMLSVFVAYLEIIYYKSLKR